MERIEYSVFDRSADCRRVDTKERWTDEFPRGASLEWSMFDGRYVLVSRVMDHDDEETEDRMESVKQV